MRKTWAKDAIADAVSLDIYNKKRSYFRTFNRITVRRICRAPSNKNTQESAGQQRDPWARVII